MKIIDNLAPNNKSLKPIKLLHCLQAFSMNGKPVFNSSENYIFVEGTVEIARVGRLMIDDCYLDLIEVTTSYSVHKIYYLGLWNDGVVAAE
jgi:hypothetical protein